MFLGKCAITILVETVGTIPDFPPPPVTDSEITVFHGLRNQDPFIDHSHVSTLSGGKGGAKKAAKEEHVLLI